MARKSKVFPDFLLPFSSFLHPFKLKGLKYLPEKNGLELADVEKRGNKNYSGDFGYRFSLISLNSKLPLTIWASEVL